MTRLCPPAALRALLATALLAAGLLLARPAPGQETVPLTAEERQWLAEHPTIRLAPDPDFPPVEFFDGEGIYRGLAADYLALLEQKLGVRFTVVPLRDWGEVLEKARSREVDMFGAAAETPQRAEYMRFTRPYLEFPAVIIANESVTAALDLEKLRGMRVAVVAGYAAHDFLRLQHPELELDLVPDVATGLRKASFGMVDAFVGNLATASFYLEKEGLTNLHVAGEAGYVYRLSLAVRGDWPTLQRILEKGLVSIGREERETIYRRWVSLGPESLLASRRFWATVLAIAAAAALAVGVVAAWNRSLKREVRRKTEKLLETGELLESVIAHIPFYVFWKDRDSRYLGCNQRFASVAGLRDRRDVLGKTDNDLAWRREEAELIRDNDRKVMERREAQLEVEEVQRQADGREAVFLTSKVPMEDADGRIIGLLGICSDVTLRKRQEGELRERQRTVTALLATLPGMVCRCRNTPQWTVEFASDGCLSLTGYRPEELTGDRKVAFVDLIHPDDREEVRRHVQEGMRERRPFRFRCRLRAKGGEERRVTGLGQGVYGEGEEPPLLTLFIGEETEG